MKRYLVITDHQVNTIQNYNEESLPLYLSVYFNNNTASFKVKIVETNNTNENSKYWQGCGERGTLRQCW
jgi:hypothetical protein